MGLGNEIKDAKAMCPYIERSHLLFSLYCSHAVKFKEANMVTVATKLQPNIELILQTSYDLI